MNLSAAELAAQTPSTDGRVLRGAKTRTAIVEALFELFKQGIYAPTTKQIAEQAQTSVRSIFQHFEDMETLYADLVAVQTSAKDLRQRFDQHDAVLLTIGGGEGAVAQR